MHIEQQDAIKIINSLPILSSIKIGNMMTDDMYRLLDPLLTTGHGAAFKNIITTKNIK